LPFACGSDEPRLWLLSFGETKYARASGAENSG